jgi:hypothetical protein
VLNNLAWALSEGLHRPDEALKHVNDLFKVTGSEVPALDTRGIILARLGRCDEAVHDMEDVVKAEPTTQHHFHLARVYLTCGRPDDARRSLELALQAGLTPREVDPAERGELEALTKKLAPGAAQGASSAPANPAPAR